jgi:Holliday junction DNA helicase RuvB
MRYPTSFDQIVGQHDAKEALRVEISRAKRRAEPLPHSLLTGGPGLGKTLIAHVIAAEMGVGFRKISPGRLKARDLYRVIFASPEMRDGDVLLLEEAHAAFAGGETPMAWLLDTLNDFTLLGHEIPRITVVLASHLGVKYAAFKSRLHEIRLSPYSHAEAVELIAACTPELLTPFPSLTPGQARSVARAGRRNPRQIRAILRQIEAVAGLSGDPATFRPEHYDLARALRLLGLSRDGLDALGRDYRLFTMIRGFAL